MADRKTLAIFLLLTIASTLEAQESATKICNLPDDPGPCRAAIKRYFYHPGSNSCKVFYFGGCKGNANNFEKEQECLQACNGTSISVVDDGPDCTLAPDEGDCRSALTRYYYDTTGKSCKKFIYGGCEGNSNNFETMDDCMSKCNKEMPTSSTAVDNSTCNQPKFPGPCRAMITRYFYNKETKTCQMFMYGGCNANANNFVRKDECERICVKNIASTPTPKDVCSLPKRVGKCRGFYPKFYFDSSTKKCTQFTYGGCDGNENNFETIDECRKTCKEKSQGTEVPTDKCMLPKKVGNCRGNFPQYYYDHEKQDCLEFIYGGCGGNANNFNTYNECIKSCDKSTQPVDVTCSLPKVSGPCMAIFERFYYNAKSGDCELFTYGGCRGNENNFKTREDCTKKCIKPIDGCKIAPGKVIAVGEEYNMDESGCTSCRCDKGGRAACIAVKCAAPSCANYRQVPGKCCEFDCLDVLGYSRMSIMTIAGAAFIAIAICILTVSFCKKKKSRNNFKHQIFFNDDDDDTVFNSKRSLKKGML